MAPKKGDATGDSLLRLPGDLLERVATCSTKGRFRVGWGLAVGCRRTRRAAEAVRVRWASCPQCGEPFNHHRCAYCDEPVCRRCRGEEEAVVCAESLHDVAEAPVVCRDCLPRLDSDDDWSRCQRCFRRLCPVCHIAGLPALQLCDDCCCSHWQ